MLLLSKKLFLCQVSVGLLVVFTVTCAVRFDIACSLSWFSKYKTVSYYSGKYNLCVYSFMGKLPVMFWLVFFWQMSTICFSILLWKSCLLCFRLVFFGQMSIVFFLLHCIAFVCLFILSKAGNANFIILFLHICHVSTMLSGLPDPFFLGVVT